MRELMLNWYAASALHTHADQGYLSAPDFMDAWGKTHTFIGPDAFALQSQSVNRPFPTIGVSRLAEPPGRRD